MTTEQSAQALEPCPWCGPIDKLDFAEGSTFRWLAYSCPTCGVGAETRVQTMGEGTREQWRARAEKDAIAEWNRRHQPAAAQLAGWKLVPVEPTPEQIQAGVDLRGKSAIAIYGAMLDAAPPPPTQPKEPSNG